MQQILQNISRKYLARRRQPSSATTKLHSLICRVSCGVFNFRVSKRRLRGSGRRLRATLITSNLTNVIVVVEVLFLSRKMMQKGSYGSQGMVYIKESATAEKCLLPFWLVDISRQSRSSIWIWNYCLSLSKTKLSTKPKSFVINMFSNKFSGITKKSGVGMYQSQSMTRICKAYNKEIINFL